MISSTIFICFLLIPFGNGYFLREAEPPWLDENGEEILDSGRVRNREPRSTPQTWHSNIRRRAVTFGQTEEEVRSVQSYLSKIKDLAASKYPELSTPALNHDSSGNEVRFVFIAINTLTKFVLFFFSKANIVIIHLITDLVSA